MGEHDKSPITWGAMMARGENDEMIGYQAFRSVRGASKVHFERTLVGPVRDTYQEAAEDARAAAEKEGS